MSNLLISEPPLVVLPSLAKTIGLNEALVLQQIHFWIGLSPLEHGGSKWMYRTDKDWIKEFCFWSDATLRRAIKSLKKLGLIRVEKLSTEFGGNSFDRKNYYTIIYPAVSALELEPNNGASGQNDQIDTSNLQNTSNDASSQNAQIEAVKLNNLSSQDDQIRCGQNAQIRSGQNDHMLKENNKRIIREGDGVVIESVPEQDSANANSENQHPVFLSDLDLVPAADLKNQRRFQMHFQWMPSAAFKDRCRMAGVLFTELTQDEQDSCLGEFRSYWEGRADQNSQSGWEHKLMQQVKRALLEKTTQETALPTGAQTRAAVSATVMNVNDTDW